MRRRTVKKPTVFDPSPESTSSGAPKSVVQPLSPSASDQTASPSQSSSSSDLPVLSPGDALTVWCEEKNPAGDPHDVPYCATVRARTASGYTIIWRCPGRDCDGVPDEVIFSEDAWLPGWHDDAGLDQAQGRAEPPTTSIEHLMQTCKISDVRAASITPRTHLRAVLLTGPRSARDCRRRSFPQSSARCATRAGEARAQPSTLTQAAPHRLGATSPSTSDSTR